MPKKVRARAAEQTIAGTSKSEAADREERLNILTERLLAKELEVSCVPGSSFVTFARDVIGLRLTPAQSAIASVLYDGQAPPAEYVETMFGGMKDAPVKGSLHTVLAVCGRGGGKTSTLIAGRALHLALTVGLEPLAKGEAGLVALVAPDQRQSRHALSFVKGFFAARPGLGRILEYDETLDIVRLKRLDGRLVTIEARPATGGGKAVRGPSLSGVLLDECAFFYDEGHAVSDVEIYRAARPRLLPGGQIVLATTPWAQVGLVWELFRDNFGKPGRAVVGKAPTICLRPGAETEEMVRVERGADPDNASREFDAEFLSGDAERFFPEPLIEKMLDRTLYIDESGQVYSDAENREIIPGEKVRSGADFAFDSDSSALVVFVERQPPRAATGLLPPTIFSVCELGEDRPLPGSNLVPSVVVGKYAAQVSRAGGKLVCADAHYRRSIEEYLTQYELAMVPAPQVPAESFLVVRALAAAGRIRIPAHPRLLAQLRRVRSTHKPGGHVAIHQPRAKDGGHGDIVSALVCALAGVTITSTQAPGEPKTRLEAQVMAEKRAREERFRKQDDATRKHGRRILRALGRHVRQDHGQRTRG